jgi:uncharacterized protein (TIGR01244 family)
MGVEASYNFRRVSDTVTTSGLIAPDDLAGLRAEGYDVVVNLLPDSSEHSIRGEAAIVDDQGLTYVYIPVDFAAPRREELDTFAEVMDAHDGKSIHVHCAANYRVSVFYGLYAVRRGTWSPDEAQQHIRGVWPDGPDPVWSDFIAEEQRDDTG